MVGSVQVLHPTLRRMTPEVPRQEEGQVSKCFIQPYGLVGLV